MKYLVILLFILITPSISQAEINEYMNDVYFANGINTNDVDAESTKEEIKIRYELYNPAFYKSVKDWKVSVNHTEGVALDLIESASQSVSIEWWGQAYKWWTDVKKYVLTLVKSAFAEYIQGEVEDQLKKSMTKILFTHQVDVETQIKSYKKSIEDGHGVIVIAHSQGNLYTHEAFNGLDDWMKPYFQTLAIASPASTVPNNGPHITFDNDAITVLPQSQGANIDNPMRKYVWIGVYNDATVTMPCIPNYALKSEQFCADSEAVYSDILTIDAHYIASYLDNTTTKTAILGSIDAFIENHNNAKSQWRISKLLGCPGRCDARVALKHVSDNGSWFNFNPIVFNPSVIAFMPRDEIKKESYLGKLYRAKDASVRGKYVKAEQYGVRIEDSNKSGICQVIKDKDKKELAEFEGDPYPTPPDIIRGAVTIQLSWDKCYRDVDLDLDVRWNTGYLDVHDDKNASFEHFVIEDEKYVYPREAPYQVYATDKTDHSLIDASQIVKSANPIDITLSAVTPNGPPLFFKTQVTSLYQLNLGHILDITVKKKLEIVYPPREYGGGGGGSSSGGGGGGIPSVDPCEGSFDCGCIPCEYTITNYLKNAMLGPISGGAVTIHNVSTNAVVYTGITSKGDDIVTTGVIEIPSEILETFVDEEIYLIDVEGGEDIDSDDDFYIDGTPTPNHGTLHAIVTGKQLKYLSFKVNILTEIAYQVSKDKLKGSKAQLVEHLDDIAKKIFRQKVLLVDETQALNYLDILTWVPTLDKQSLKKDYDTHVDPIVQKVYANKDRLQESYDFVYKSANVNAPEIGTLNVRISEGLPVGAVVGSLEILTHGDSNIKQMNLEGLGTETFSISKEGVVSVVKDMNTSVKFYSLTATATNENNYKSISVAVLISIAENKGITVPGGSVPYVTSIVTRDIDENSPEGLVVGKVTFDDVNNSLTSVQIEGGSTQFDVALDGTITVAANADIDYEKTQSIALKISAINSIGNSSLPVTVNITVNDVIDTPVYKIFFVTHIDENLSSGSVIGQLEQVRAGASEISSIDILNSNVPFMVDTNGTIRLDGYVDYETKNEYNLVAIARSARGNSNRIYMNIYINDVVEVGIPELYDFTATIDENIPSGTMIGTLNFLAGQSAIASMTLRGVGSSNFVIDTNGVLSTASHANIDYESLNAYDLEVIARNTNGSSNVAHVRIDVNDVLDVPYELLSFTASIDENVSVGTIVGKLNIASQGDGNITDYTLTGTGFENFSIDENGTIRVSSSANLDYETMTSYTLQATVLSDAGESDATQVRIYILNVAEHVPVLKPFIESVEENATIGTIVGQVEEDIGGDSPIISYILSDSGLIRIDSNGTLYLNQDINYAATPTINLQVYATNSAGESNASDINITVQQMLYNGDSTENTLIGSSRDEIFDAKGGNDTIQSGGGDDSVTGGKGNDIIIDEGGDDSYYYTLGDGNDTIEDHRGEDILYIHGTQKEKCRYEISGRDMVIVVENNETITLKNWADNNYKIETFMFDDGQSVTVDEFNHPIVKADAGIVDLSKLGNTHAQMVVQGFVRPLEGGYDAVDHWVFHYEGGELIIDILSELASNGHTYIDIDGDGKQTGLDVYIYLFKKDQNANWITVRGNDDSSAGTADGSSHNYDSYLSLDLEEGDYMLSVSNFSLSSSVALTDQNSAGSYPQGGPYQITFNTALEFSAFPDNANNNLYGSDHYNFYVLRNDLDPYNVDELYILNPEIFDENGTRSNSMGRAESMGNYLSYYPEDTFSESNTSHGLNIVYVVSNKNGIECRSLLSLQLIPDMYMHVDTKVNRDIWATIKEDCPMDLNISKGK